MLDTPRMPKSSTCYFLYLSFQGHQNTPISWLFCCISPEMLEYGAESNRSGPNSLLLLKAETETLWEIIDLPLIIGFPSCRVDTECP